MNICLEINPEDFYESLNTLRESRKLTWAQVAAQSGVNSTTLIHMAQGKRPNEETLTALVKWSGFSELQLRCCLTKLRESKSKSQPQTLIPESYFSGDRNFTPESVAALNTVIKEGSKRLFSNYTKLAGKWMRRSSAELDRLCEQQRLESLWHHDRFHYRRSAITSNYRYWLQQGKSRKEAYEKAQLTQLNGLNPCIINLDARTTLTP
jgi:transcriptional regulator with XRE-family HTH domain